MEFRTDRSEKNDIPNGPGVTALRQRVPPVRLARVVFFTSPVPAEIARRLGTGLLREAMAMRGRIKMDSSDRTNGDTR
jgi:hypothetical protein